MIEIRTLGVRKSVADVVKTKCVKLFPYAMCSHPNGYVKRSYSDDFTKKRLLGQPEQVVI